MDSMVHENSRSELGRYAYKHDMIEKMTYEKELLYCISPPAGYTEAYSKNNFKVLAEFLEEKVEVRILHSFCDAMTLEDYCNVSTKKIIENSNNRRINICGWCSGGLLAVEIARKLQKSNLKLGKVILINSCVEFLRDNTGEKKYADDRDGCEYVSDIHFLLQIATNSAACKADIDLASELSDEQKRNAVIDVIKKELEIDENDLKDIYAKYRYIKAESDEKLNTFFSGYYPDAYQGDVVLIYSNDLNGCVSQWQDILSSYHTVNVNCEEYSILRNPYASVVANSIIEELK